MIKKTILFFFVFQIQHAFALKVLVDGNRILTFSEEGKAQKLYVTKSSWEVWKKNRNKDLIKIKKYENFLNQYTSLEQNYSGSSHRADLIFVQGSISSKANKVLRTDLLMHLQKKVKKSCPDKRYSKIIVFQEYLPVLENYEILGEHSLREAQFKAIRPRISNSCLYYDLLHQYGFSLNRYGLDGEDLENGSNDKKYFMVERIKSKMEYFIIRPFVIFLGDHYFKNVEELSSHFRGSKILLLNLE